MVVFDNRVSPEAAERIRARVADVTQEIAQAEPGRYTGQRRDRLLPAGDVIPDVRGGRVGLGY